MKTGDYYFSYCTNIHPGEKVPDLLTALQQNIPLVRQSLGGEPLGLGLRLSNQMTAQLQDAALCQDFRQQLSELESYALCANGFPFGVFHQTSVKDKVHRPDWTKPERLSYSQSLATALARLLPDHLDEAGFSTSPISYAPWAQGDPMRLWELHVTAANQLAALVAHLVQVKEHTGKTIFVEIEPEPDGVLETSAQAAEFMRGYLLIYGKGHLMNLTGAGEEQAIEWLQTHVRICWDVCHFSVLFEAPAEVYTTLTNAGWRIGRLQASSALAITLPTDAADRAEVWAQLAAFDEPTYLHQVAARTESGRILRFTDLAPAVTELQRRTDVTEVRSHFHVPLFMPSFGLVGSTQADVSACMDLLQQHRYTRVVEAETYTWGVLPTNLQLPLDQSIAREIAWLRQHVLPASIPSAAVQS